MGVTPPDYTQLAPALTAILRQYPEGISEYLLLKQVAAQFDFFESQQDSPLDLFQRHFYLFHTLYRLQQTLLAEQQGHLDISPLEIRLRPFCASHSDELAPADPLRLYYLDIQHLYNTDQAQVDDLLAHFWTRLMQRDQRSEALAILDLVDPVDDRAIKQRYRELVMQHHPDRGGDTAKIQLINAALASLLP